MLTLEIDCPPGTIRPDALYNQLMKNIDESLMNATIKQLLVFWEDKEPITKQFGSWTWELREVLNETDKKELTTFIYNKLLGFHEDSIIRYGSIN